MGTWSGLRKKIRERIIPELSKRVDFHYTKYESKGSKELPQKNFNSRFWITFDGKEIFSVSRLDKTQDGYTPEDYVEALKGYLNLSIPNALKSSHPLPPALVMLDSRFAKGAVKRFQLAHNATFLIQETYKIRSEIENKEET